MSRLAKESAARHAAWFFQCVSVAAMDQELTCRDVAAKAKISPSYFSMMRNGKRPLSLAAMLKIGDALDLEVTITLKPRE